MTDILLFLIPYMFFVLFLLILRTIRIKIADNQYLKTTINIIQYFLYFVTLLIAIKTPVELFHDSFSEDISQQLIINTKFFIVVLIAFCLNLLTSSPQKKLSRPKIALQ